MIRNLIKNTTWWYYLINECDQRNFLICPWLHNENWNLSMRLNTLFVLLYLYDGIHLSHCKAPLPSCVLDVLLLCLTLTLQSSVPFPLDAGVSSLLICPVEPRCLAPHLSGQLLSPSDNQLTSKTHFQLIISFVLVFPQNCVLCSLLAFYEVIYTHYLMKILFFKISDCQVFVFHCLLSNRKW